MRIRSLTFALAMVSFLATPAFAQEKLTKEQIEQARQHFKLALDAEKAGNHEAAVSNFIAAYEITKDPKLFYQIGRAYETGGKKREATIYYRRYLNEVDDLSDEGRAEVRGRIEKLTGKPATGSGTGPPKDTSPTQPTPPGDTGETPPEDQVMAPTFEDTPPAGQDPETLPPPFMEEPARWQRTAAWISVGVAAVFVTTGGVMALSANSREEDLGRLVNFRDENQLPSRYQGNVREEYEDARDEGERFEKLSLYSFLGAGVATTAAVIFFVLDPGSPTADTATAVSPYAGPDGAGLFVTWEL